MTRGLNGFANAQKFVWGMPASTDGKRCRFALHPKTIVVLSDYGASADGSDRARCFWCISIVLQLPRFEAGSRFLWPLSCQDACWLYTQLSNNPLYNSAHQTPSFLVSNGRPETTGDAHDMLSVARQMDLRVLNLNDLTNRLMVVALSPVTPHQVHRIASECHTTRGVPYKEHHRADRATPAPKRLFQPTRLNFMDSLPDDLYVTIWDDLITSAMESSRWSDAKSLLTWRCVNKRTASLLRTRVAAWMRMLYNRLETLLTTSSICPCYDLRKMLTQDVGMDVFMCTEAYFLLRRNRLAYNEVPSDVLERAYFRLRYCKLSTERRARYREIYGNWPPVVEQPDVRSTMMFQTHSLVSCDSYGTPARYATRSKTRLQHGDARQLIVNLRVPSNMVRFMQSEHWHL